MKYLGLALLILSLSGCPTIQYKQDRIIFKGKEISYKNDRFYQSLKNLSRIQELESRVSEGYW